MLFSGHRLAKRRRGRRPRASAMDFEDGKRGLWLVTAAGGRRGGLPPGSVYRLKMAVWALFCGPRGRLPVRPPRARCLESASVGTRAPGSPRPASSAARDPEFRSGLGAGKEAPSAPRPPESPDRPPPRCEQIARKPPTSRSGRAGLPRRGSRSPAGQRPRSIVLSVNPQLQVTTRQVEFSEAC